MCTEADSNTPTPDAPQRVWELSVPFPVDQLHRMARTNALRQSASDVGVVGVLGSFAICMLHLLLATDLIVTIQTLGGFWAGILTLIGFELTTVRGRLASWWGSVAEDVHHYRLSPSGVEIRGPGRVTTYEWHAVVAFQRTADLVTLTTRNSEALFLPRASVDESLWWLIVSCVAAAHRWPLECERCHCNLHGLPEPRCPECGTPIAPDSIASDSAVRS